MKTEFKPEIAEETMFHPPPRPGVPDQCQNPPASSTAHASVELVSKTEASLPALDVSPEASCVQATPVQKTAIGLPVIPPTATPESAVRAFGGPNETPYRFTETPDGI
jgi:hypothetical protein